MIVDFQDKNRYISKKYWDDSIIKWNNNGIINNKIQILESMSSDKIYSKKLDKIRPFEFNETVVNVFDDMLNRSVPLYRETIKRQVQLSERFYQPGSMIFDFGCSNGNFGLRLLEIMGKKDFSMTAVDNSREMLKTYKERLSNRPNEENIELVYDKIQNVIVKNASVVIVNLTLQFIPVAERANLIKTIYDGLLPSGILLITEKTVHENDSLTKLQQEFYYKYKKENGYSNLEISQKRDALENVLIPETIESHNKRFNDAGFDKIDIWQKWFNFTSFLCQK